MPQGDGHKRLGYEDYYGVDGGKSDIILAALVVPAEVRAHQPAIDLLWCTRLRWKLWLRQIAGHTTHGMIENNVAIEDQRIRAHMPLSEAGR